MSRFIPLTLALLGLATIAAAEQPAEAIRYESAGRPAVPLLGQLVIDHDEPSVDTLAITLDGGGEQLSRPLGPDDITAEDGTITVPLPGLKAATGYTARVRLQADGRDLGQPRSVAFTTAAVPQPFPAITVSKQDGSRLEPGHTLFNLIRWSGGKPDFGFGAIVAVDADGDVRWLYRADHLIFIVRPLPGGNLLYGYGNRTDGLIEIDRSGTIINQWAASGRDRTVPPGATAVDVESMHHDAILVNDNLVTLATEMRPVTGYLPRDYDRRRLVPQANVIGDLVAEFTPDGRVVRRLPLLDVLEPRRIGYGAMVDFWKRRGYETVPGGTVDWSHSNSITYDPSDDSFIVSVRHQDAVVKLDRATGQLKWILGDPSGWPPKLRRKCLKPRGRVEWFYHQHAVEITPHGTLLLFDNGNYGAVPFKRPRPATASRSRAVEFRIDEAAGTVEQVWEDDGGDRPFYSTFLCDVDWLPQTGHVLITNGGEIRDADGRRTDVVPGVSQWGEIYEVTHEDQPRRLLTIDVRAADEDAGEGWSIYRAERIDGFPR